MHKIASLGSAINNAGNSTTVGEHGHFQPLYMRLYMYGKR